MRQRRERQGAGIFGGLLFLALGTVLLLGNLELFPVRPVLSQWWPAILILFGIMMTHRDPVMLKRGDTSRLGVFAGVLVAAVSAIGLILLIRKTTWFVAPETAEMRPTTAASGDALMTEYVLPFELISVLLLVVLCGAAYLARRTRVEEA